MRRFASQEDYATREDVERDYPGAILVEVDEGWIVFDTVDEYETWQRQI